MNEFSLEELNILRNCELLRSISEKNFNTFIGLSSKKIFNAGDVLLEEGEYNNYLFIILSGTVQLFKRSKKKQHIIGHLSEGQSVGEMRIIKNQLCTLTVTAKQPTAVLSVPLSRLRHLNYNQCYESILDGIVTILSERLVQTNSLAIYGIEAPRGWSKKFFLAFAAVTIVLFVLEVGVALYYFLD